MEQVLQLLVQQQTVMAKQTKQQGAHMDGLVQLHIQATEQLKGVIEDSRRAMVQVLEQSVFGASAASLGPTGMAQTTKDDDSELFGDLQTNSHTASVALNHLGIPAVATAYRGSPESLPG